uniref:Uncharacterized protein n=1 Tax=Dunaliella tertiolecta TaxID=3047 RepID=A0A7S3R455_DUNTE|mmetsp:Transcript_5526/g.14905  ORF Transcript_5526/g.14905 Transcript_5526/m.14905 type:complete len:394 (-) Transcript_5526:470-1651(-)
MDGERLAQLQEQLQKRERTESDLRGILANKDAEAARLRAEVNRLRQAFSKADGLHEAHASEMQDLQAQLHQAQQASKASERQALLTSSAPAASTAQGEVHRLRAQLDASTAENARLEAELGKQGASAAARLTELQDSYTAKIADMRRVHREQLSVLEESARQQQQEQQQQGAEGAQLRALQAEVAALKQQAVAHKSEMAALEGRLATEQQAVVRLTRQLEDARSSAAGVQQQHAQEVEVLRTARADAEAHAAEAQRQLQAKGQGSPAADDGMAAMLSMMEGQLARLVDTIRAKDAEVGARDAELAALRHAVTSGCEERRELAMQLEKAQARAAAAAAPAGAGFASQHAQQQRSPQSGSTSPSGVPVHHPHAHNHAGAGKPYRAGLISRPKFKA